MTTSFQKSPAKFDSGDQGRPLRRLVLFFVMQVPRRSAIPPEDQDYPARPGLRLFLGVCLDLCNYGLVEWDWNLLDDLDVEAFKRSHFLRMIG